VTDAPDRSVAGDNDTWILFDRLTDDGYPLVVLARTGNAVVEHALRNQIVTVVSGAADVSLVNDRGMPQHTDRLYPVEEGLARELSAFDVGAFHVASVTGDGQRRMVFAHATALDFGPVLQLFHPEGYTLSVVTFDDREVLVDLVTPTSLDRQLNGDMGVISNLQKNGDDGLVPRRTDFWFYGELEHLASLVEELGPWGYVVDRWLEDPQGVVLFSETSVDFDTFRGITPVLVGAAEKHGVTYDGWETFVVRLGVAEVVPSTAPKPKSLLSKLFGAKKN
jgi:hypothetical protein